MREISEITTDLQKAASELTGKNKAHEAATLAAQKAFQELDAVQVRINKLREELNDSLNLLVPQSFNNRVRKSA